MNKLLEIQRQLIVRKSQFNSFGKYNFRSTEDILTALKPLLVKTECFITMTDDIIQLGENVYVKATVIFHGENSEIKTSSVARDAIIQKGMNASQVTNSASSFARKQALSGMFLIDDSGVSIQTDDEIEENDKLLGGELEDIFKKIETKEQLMNEWNKLNSKMKKIAETFKNEAKKRIGL